MMQYQNVPAAGRNARPSWLAPCAALLLLALVVLAGAGCGARYVGAPPIEPRTPIPAQSPTRHVVLVSIDGLRPDAIDAFAAPTLQRLMREGSYTLTASTVVPSKTLPSHTSMLSGLPPDQHGILWNEAAQRRGRVLEAASIFGVARAQGYTTAAFFSKSKFHALQQPGALDFSQAPRGWWGAWRADRTTRDVEQHLRTARPNLLFVHLADPDHAGHRSGWMGSVYGRSVATADAAIARVLLAADRAFGAGNYAVIVTADHGGHDFDHGTDDPRDVTIPWIAWGRGVEAGAQVTRPVFTTDTAASVLWLLGLVPPDGWQARPVYEAFGVQPRAAAAAAAFPLP